MTKQPYSKLLQNLGGLGRPTTWNFENLLIKPKMCSMPREADYFPHKNRWHGGCFGQLPTNFHIALCLGTLISTGRRGRYRTICIFYHVVWKTSKSCHSLSQVVEQHFSCWLQIVLSRSPLRRLFILSGQWNHSGWSTEIYLRTQKDASKIGCSSASSKSVDDRPSEVPRSFHFVNRS